MGYLQVVPLIGICYLATAEQIPILMLYFGKLKYIYCLYIVCTLYIQSFGHHIIILSFISKFCCNRYFTLCQIYLTFLHITSYLQIIPCRLKLHYTTSLYCIYNNYTLYWHYNTIHIQLITKHLPYIIYTLSIYFYYTATQIHIKI